MGICGSAMSIEVARSKEIEDALACECAADRRAVKLLLLGAGESGKSTIFKQLRLLYGRGFTDDDRRGYTGVVHANTLGAIKTLLGTAAAWGVAPASVVRYNGGMMEGMGWGVGGGHSFSLR